MYLHNSYLDESIIEENYKFNNSYINRIGCNDFYIEADKLHGEKWAELGYNSCQTVWFQNIDRLMNFLIKKEINPIDFSLIDIGSGNGLSTIYFAQNYTFKNITGIEINRELNNISIANQKKVNLKMHKNEKPLKINFKCLNAEGFKIQDVKSIIFMFNSMNWNAFKNLIIKNLENLKKNKSIILLANDHCINEILAFSKLIERDDQFNLSAVYF